MFYVKEVINGAYMVVDTTDNSVEACSVEELKEFKKMGIHIEGLKKPLGDLSKQFRLLIDLDGHTVGIDQYGEVIGFYGNGLCSYAGRVRYQASYIRLLSKHQVTQTGYALCIEEIKVVGADKRKYFKTHVYYLDIRKQTIKLVDSMDDFCAGSHLTVKTNPNGLIFGRKIISKQSLINLVS